MEIKDILKNRRTELNLTMKELSVKVGVSEGTISRWESGEISNMKRDKIVALADALQISPSVIMGWDDNKDTHSNVSPSPLHSTGTIPVVGRVAAGEPIFAEENIIKYIDVPEKWSNEEYFGLVISGDSMEPKINDKDVVIIHRQEDAESGEIVIATINGDDAVCKRLTKYANGIALLSINPNYDPIDVTGREDFRIIGKVVQLRRDI